MQSASAPRLVGIASRPRPADAMVETAEIEISQSGVVGEKRAGQKRQVSILAREAWETAAAEAGAPELPWTTRRANLLVEGVDLADTIGRRLRIGDVVLEVTAETDPCHLMDRAREGLLRALTPDWRGGASCRVVTPGVARVDDAVCFED